MNTVGQNIIEVLRHIETEDCGCDDCKEVIKELNPSLSDGNQTTH